MHNPSKTLSWTSWDLHIYHTEIIIMILSAASRDGVLVVVVFKASASQDSASLASLPPSKEYVVST